MRQSTSLVCTWTAINRCILINSDINFMSFFDLLHEWSKMLLLIYNLVYFLRCMRITYYRQYIIAKCTRNRGKKTFSQHLGLAVRCVNGSYGYRPDLEDTSGNTAGIKEIRVRRFCNFSVNRFPSQSVDQSGGVVLGVFARFTTALNARSPSSISIDWTRKGARSSIKREE